MITWFNGTYATIQWEDLIVSAVDISLSVTSGTTWGYTIAQNINSTGDFNGDSYSYLVSATPSSACYVRILDHGSQIELLRSNQFQILNYTSGNNSFGMGGKMVSGNIIDINGAVVASNAQILSVNQDGSNVRMIYFDTSTGTLRAYTRYLGSTSSSYAQPYVNLTTSGATVV